MLAECSYYLGNPFRTIPVYKLSHLSDISISSISESMSSNHADIITSLTNELDNLTTSATAANVEVDGVAYSSDVLMIHELIKNHNAIYDARSSPGGVWTFSGMREIKKRGGATNPNFQLPDGIATFYGDLSYDYKVSDEYGTKIIPHDVICMSPILLDLKSRGPPKDPNAGIYGIDWWNIYTPLKLLSKLNQDIMKVSGYRINEEGIIKDASQGLASVTINIRDHKDSPPVTMISVQKGEEEEEEGGEFKTDENEGRDSDEDNIKHQSMGTLKDIMEEGGEDDILGGVGFFSIGISCKGNAGAEAPPAGSTVKLSMKMKAFHALNVIDSGVRRIGYQSKSAGLRY